MSWTIVDSIIVAGLGGFIAGISVWGVNELKKYYTLKTDLKMIYDFLHKQTRAVRGTHNRIWYSTLEIANYTSLPVDRVVYVCSVHSDITNEIPHIHWKHGTDDLLRHEKNDVWAIKSRAILKR